MTIGIAWSCAGGIGILTDSFWNTATPDGRFIPHPGVRSFHRLPIGAAVVISGNLTRDLAGVDELCARIKASTVDAAAHELFRQLEAEERQLQANWSMYNTLGLDNDGRSPEVLVAAPSVIGLLTPGKQEWLRMGERRFLAVGAWCRYFLEPLALLDRPVPATLDGCLRRATAWARSYIAALYGGSSLEAMLADGRTPTVGFPLRAILFRPDVRQEYQILESGDIMTPMEALP